MVFEFLIKQPELQNTNHIQAKKNNNDTNNISKNIRIFNNQESSNLKNILKANCLIYYDRTTKLRLYQVND